MGTRGASPVRADLAVAAATAAMGALNAVTASVVPQGFVNISVHVPSAFVGVVVAERSFDNGTTWHPVWHVDPLSPVEFTASGSTVFMEPESGMVWRMRCSAYTSGTANARLSF